MELHRVKINQYYKPHKTEAALMQYVTVQINQYHKPHIGEAAVIQYVITDIYNFIILVIVI